MRGGASRGRAEPVVRGRASREGGALLEGRGLANEGKGAKDAGLREAYLGC